jgi:hypothetical protein
MRQTTSVVSAAPITTMPANEQSTNRRLDYHRPQTTRVAFAAEAALLCIVAEADAVSYKLAQRTKGRMDGESSDAQRGTAGRPLNVGEGRSSWKQCECSPKQH